ncbi:MAG: hypothetical protein ACC742_10020 [Thermoanaerobaculales bacterium]
MKSYAKVMLGALLAVVIALTWTACTSDGYSTGTSTVYVGHGYGGYGPGWGYGWGGYGGHGGHWGYGPRW